MIGSFLSLIDEGEMSGTAGIKAAIRYKAPIARDDHQQAYEDILGFIAIEDLLLNDSGGNAVVFHGLDQADPTRASVVGDTARTALGALIRLEADGTISYGASDPILSARLQALAEGETREDQFTYSIRLGSGALSVATVFVTVTGMNDDAVFALRGTDADLGTVQENGATQADGTLSFTDVDLGDLHSVSVRPAEPGTRGVLTADLLADSTGVGEGRIAWSYVVANAALQGLAAGETVAESFTIELSDGWSSVSHVVTITLAGENDAPVIQALAGDSAGVDSLTETDAGLRASGTLTVTDADIRDTVAVAVAGVALGADAPAVPAALMAALPGMLHLTPGPIAADPGESGNLAWRFDSGWEAFNFLAQGEELRLHYTIRADDGQGGPPLGDGVVTIVIRGSNDAPTTSVAFPDSGSVTEFAEGDPREGSLREEFDAPPGYAGYRGGGFWLYDPDASDTHAVTVTALGEGYRTSVQARVEHQAAGAAHPGTHFVHWTFSVPESSFEFLGQGESLTETFRITAADPWGGTTSRDVSVVLNGANDAPIILATPVFRKRCSAALLA